MLYLTYIIGVTLYSIISTILISILILKGLRCKYHVLITLLPTLFCFIIVPFGFLSEVIMLLAVLAVLFIKSPAFKVIRNSISPFEHKLISAYYFGILFASLMIQMKMFSLSSGFSLLGFLSISALISYFPYSIKNSVVSKTKWRFIAFPMVAFLILFCGLINISFVTNLCQKLQNSAICKSYDELGAKS